MFNIGNTTIKNEKDNDLLSNTVGWDLRLDGVALDADEFGVLAAVGAEGIAPGDSSEEEQTKAPGDSHATDGLSGDIASIFSTGRAWGSISSSTVSSDGDDSRSLLDGWGRVHWLGCHHHGLGCHHHWLSVHV